MQAALANMSVQVMATFVESKWFVWRQWQRAAKWFKNVREAHSIDGQRMWRIVQQLLNNREK
eukprot:535508-Prorocentrum_lima.AAC.1